MSCESHDGSFLATTLHYHQPLPAPSPRTGSHFMTIRTKRLSQWLPERPPPPQHTSFFAHANKKLQLMHCQHSVTLPLYAMQPTERIAFQSLVLSSIYLFIPAACYLARLGIHVYGRRRGRLLLREVKMESHDWWLDYLSNPVVGRFRSRRGIQTDSCNSFQSSPLARSSIEDCFALYSEG